MAPPGPEQLPPNNGSNPKRHHVVPRFYLERFAVKNCVEVVERNDFAKSYPPTPVERVLTERYFYSVDTEIGREPLGEFFLRDHVDTPASVEFPRIFDQGRPLAGPQQRGVISVFLAFQYVRGPVTRDTVVEEAKAIAAKTGSLMTPKMILHGARERGEEITEAEAIEHAAFARSGQYTVDILRKANLHIGAAFPSVMKTLPWFYDRAWQVLEFDEPCLLTSDEPVALVGDDETSPGQGDGLALAPKIVFPVDPRHALVMLHPALGAEDVRRRGRPEEAKMINEHVAFSAHRAVVRTPGTDPLAGMKLPKKAPPVIVVGDFIGTTPNHSVAAQARKVERVRSRFGKAAS